MPGLPLGRGAADLPPRLRERLVDPGAGNRRWGVDPDLLVRRRRGGGARRVPAAHGTLRRFGRARPEPRRGGPGRVGQGVATGPDGEEITLAGLADTQLGVSVGIGEHRAVLQRGGGDATHRPEPLRRSARPLWPVWSLPNWRRASWSASRGRRDASLRALGSTDGHRCREGAGAALGLTAHTTLPVRSARARARRSSHDPSRRGGPHRPRSPGACSRLLSRW